MDDAHCFDLMGAVGRELLFDLSRVDAVSPIARPKSISSPRRVAIARHRLAKWPVSNISARSPGDKLFDNAAFHAPVPDDG